MDRALELGKIFMVDTRALTRDTACQIDRVPVCRPPRIGQSNPKVSDYSGESDDLYGRFYNTLTNSL